MAAVALVRDVNFPHNYHTIVINEKEFKKKERETKDACEKMSLAWKVAIAGAALTTVGGIYLITQIANDNVDASSISMTALGVIVDIVACCLGCSK